MDITSLGSRSYDPPSILTAVDAGTLPRGKVLMVPNWSFGRSSSVKRTMQECMALHEVTVHFCESDFDHNRTVTAFSGDILQVLVTFEGLCKLAFDAIDLRRHMGQHPRIGALDVCPFIAFPKEIPNAFPEDQLIDLSQRVGGWIADSFDIPVYFYEKSAKPGKAHDLPTLRRGGFGSLIDKVLDPDEGPEHVNPQWGVTVVGVRDFLIAMNVNLMTDQRVCADRIAKEIRDLRRSGDPAFAGVRSLGITLASRHLTQVSLNLTKPDMVSPDQLISWVEKRAHDHGIKVANTELIGVIRNSDLDRARQVFPAKAQVVEWVPSALNVGRSSYDLGILGGGQLGRMSAMAAQRMGLKVLVLDPEKDCPAGQVAEVKVGAITVPGKIAEMFRKCDRVTLENEFIPADAIARGINAADAYVDSFVPGVKTLRTIQDKLTQREALIREGVPSPNAASTQLRRQTFPLVMKARFGGYDGKGTKIIHTEAELKEHEKLLGEGGWMVEEYVPFVRELAVMVCRSENQTVCFPTMETRQVNNVCDLVLPSGTDASEIAIQAVEAVEGFGLFGVELFELADGTFQVNEIAPRPHNTGHYSLDWGGISQFEAHVRLVMGYVLPPALGQPAAMANLLGIDTANDWRSAMQEAIAEVPDAFFHWYGKKVSKPGRKMGHINAVGSDAADKVVAARQAFYRAWRS